MSCPEKLEVDMLTGNVSCKTFSQADSEQVETDISCETSLKIRRAFRVRIDRKLKVDFKTSIALQTSRETDSRQVENELCMQNLSDVILSPGSVELLIPYSLDVLIFDSFKLLIS